MLKEKFKVDHVVNVMLGEVTTEIQSYLHDKLEMFGCQKDKTAKFLSAVITQGIIAGYIDRDIENYGLLKVTKRGKEFLKSPSSFMVVEDRDFSLAGEQEVRGGTGAIEKENSVVFDSSSLCHLPGPIARGYGHNLSHHHGRIAKYPRCGSW